jgi:hypothetical protein
MAPRAGFEVGRKLLSVHIVTCTDDLSTPARTPLLASLEVATSARASMSLQSRGALSLGRAAGVKKLTLLNASVAAERICIR